MKASHKFLLFGSVLVILLLGGTSWLIQDTLRVKAEKEIVQSLEAVRDTTHQAVKSWVKEHAAEVSVWANIPRVVQLTEQLLELPRTSQALLDSSAQQEFRTFIQPLWTSSNHQGFLIISPDYVNLASSRDGDVGKINALIKSQKFYQTIFNGNPAISLPDISKEPLKDSDGVVRNKLPTMFIGAPIRNQTGKVIA
ncbi:hypothetical protein, partial [Kaarinaea lacus]